MTSGAPNSRPVMVDSVGSGPTGSGPHGTAPTSEAILARLQNLHPKKIDLSLGRIDRLLERLGRPERRLPPVTHIAGTNGKGSTLAMLDAMLAADGRRVQRYISPHLVRFNERILIGGEPIDEALLAAVLDECERANGGEPITFFEITTAAAFLAFSRAPADILLLETGLGGLFDATNVIERPLLTLISPVSMDHEAFLGTTLAEIAVSKAGILKPGVTGIVGPQPAPAREVIEARAAEIGAPLLVHGRDWEATRAEAGIRLREGENTMELPRPRLLGVHQIENGGLAAMAARHLGPLAVSLGAIAHGLKEASWAARLQRLRRGPLVERLGGVHELWLDGGHNPAAGEMLAKSLPALAHGRPIHLVIGMMQTKDAASFLGPLLALARSVRMVPVPGEGAGREPAELAAIALRQGAEATAVASVGQAIAELAGILQTPAFVLVCGSLYLAGAVLRDNS